jgi:hypothetical protein
VARKPLLRFTGEIAGAGSTSGVRLVVGRWDESPFGAFADVMVQDSSGHRTLLAPTDEVAEFISATYVFDEVVVRPVVAEVGSGGWQVRAGDLLDVALEVGGRMPLGWVLRVPPARLATSRALATAADPVARVLLRGVRTRGSAGGGRREWYGAVDQHRVTGLVGSWRGLDLGALAPVDPPCDFGFSSTPTTPSVTSVTTTIRL